MALLQVVQKFCVRTGLPKPAFAAASTDTQITQLVELLNELLGDLVSEHWTQLVNEAVFVTVAGEDQGLLTTIASNGFQSVLNETIYNRTTRLPIYGPIKPQVWQNIKALPQTGPFYKYRIVRERLLINPAIPAGHTCAFEYSSINCVTSSAGTRKAAFTEDTDVCLFDERLLILGLRWKWKSEKGLDYAEEFRAFEELRLRLHAKDGTKPVLDMGSENRNPTPGIFVSPGNWPL